jgi:hypothetical protein
VAQTRLEFLISRYHKTRNATQRLLRRLSAEEITWQPSPSLPPIYWSFGRLAAHEEIWIHRRNRGIGVLEESFTRCFSEEWLPVTACPPVGKSDLSRRLNTLNRATGRFLRRVLDGEQTPRRSDLLEQMDSLILQETQMQGEVECLRRIRLAQAAARITPSRSLEADAAVPSARKALA